MYTPDELTKKDLEAAEEYLGKMENKWLSFAATYKSGRTHIYPGRACYAAIMSQQNAMFPVPGDRLNYFLDKVLAGGPQGGIGGKELSKEERLFISWTLNNSVWSENFVTKDVDKANTVGTISLCHFPGDFVVQGCMVLRCVVEKPSMAPTWYLLQKHCDPHLALLLAHQVYVDGEEFKLAYIEGHTPFYSYQNDGLSIKRMINKDFSLFDGKPMSTHPWHKYYMNRIWTQIPQQADFNAVRNRRLKLPKAFLKTKKDQWGYDKESCSFSISEAKSVMATIMKENGL